MYHALACSYCSRLLSGSLIRGGPLPFIQRIINADGYEQGVYKFMVTEKCDRLVSYLMTCSMMYNLVPCLTFCDSLYSDNQEAQGNMVSSF